MKMTAILAGLGAAPFAASLLLYPKPAELKPIKVKTAIIRQIPITKANTLVERWHFPHVVMVKVAAAGNEIPLPSPRPVIEEAKSEPKVHTKRDVCSQHGMRKVQYGRRWRCRR